MQTSFSFSTSKNIRGVLLGLLLVMAGLLFLSFNFGWIDPALKSVFFSWPVIFIVFAIIGFSKRNYVISFFWLILGVFFLLPRIATVYPNSLPGVDGDFAYNYWPLLLILLGVGLIMKIGLAKQKNNERELFSIADDEDQSHGRIEKRVVFGGSESIFLEPVFYGGEISATFGGVVLDLRRTQLPEGVTRLNIDATFGGVELHIPGDWSVETKLDEVFGGVEDKRLVSAPDHSRKLIIQGSLIFGGCEIR